MNFRLCNITLIVVAAFVSTYAHAQNVQQQTTAADSIVKYQYHSVDSLHQNFQHRTDSLQRAYAKPVGELHQQINKLNHKKDSLSRLKLPTASVTHQIDSLQQAQRQKLQALNNDISKVKQQTLTKAQSLKLPPEAQKEIDQLAKNVKGFSVPNNFFRMPNLNMKIPGMSLPVTLPSNLSIPMAKLPALQKFNLNTAPQLPSISKVTGSLTSEIKQLQSSANLQSAEKTVMKDLSQNGEIKSVLKEESEVKNMESQLAKAKDAKNAEALAKQQLQPAVNHFAGKEKELQAAMSKVSKLKEKYSNVTSLAELPKRPPNPLKNKPWFERVVPGLNYFIQSRQYTMVDINPYVGWRFNPKLTAAIGWNERIGVMHGHLHTRMYDRVFGVRSTVTYAWAHGFVFKIAPELMNAYVPTSGNVDDKTQQLVFGVYAGIRKDFKLYKSVNGYSEALYNFTQKPGRNIYGDPVTFRLGFEVGIKAKRVKRKA